MNDFENARFLDDEDEFGAIEGGQSMRQAESESNAPDLYATVHVQPPEKPSLLIGAKMAVAVVLAVSLIAAVAWVWP